ncbi:MAG: penicillin-binding transpeptidase domain-containing protein, partial [Candidatus Hydrogenedentota bacterium]
QYFGKSCADLTLGECATLAGLTRAPNANEPIHNPENARIRRDIVLTQMIDNGFITRAEFDAAKTEDLAKAVITPEERQVLAEQGQATWDPKRFQAPYFVEEVRRFVTSPPPPYETNVSTQQVLEEGLQVHTTIDMRLQRAAEEILIRHMDEFDADKRAWLAKRNRSEEFIPISAALVCLDNRPGVEGFVRAMVGGRNFAEKKFNMATQAERQPGSSVKPFVWLAAIDNGMTCSTVIVDEPFSRVDGAGNLWTPKNFGGEYLGPIPISLALEKSVNVVSVTLVERLGMPLVRSYLRDAGFQRPIEDIVGLTIGLGTPVTTILDHAVCYSTLAHNGTRYDPVMVTDIQDRDGFTLYDYRDFRQKEVDALPPDATFAVVRMMQGVCEADYKRNHYPTGWRTHELERPRAGKTGTTNDSRDLWFCGFTPQFTCIVWFGYEDNSSLGTGRDFTGGHVSQPVWTEFMKAAHEGLPVEDFTVPPGVEFFNVERMTGVAGGDWKAAFIRGSRPPEEFSYDTLLDVEGLLEDL